MTTSKIEDNKFYLGQQELSLMCKKIIRTYQYHNSNELPEAIVIPYLEEVEGVPILYELLPYTPMAKVEEPTIVESSGDQDTVIKPKRKKDS